jgi:uncharacterized membrane protein YdjX (TVP38/TMEM64 family)
MLIAAAYVAASLVFFPRPLLTLAFVIIFGPWQTAVYGLAGLLVAAAAAFWFGARHGAPRLQTLANPGLKTIATKLQRGGIYSVVVMRMLPVAPYTIVNLFAGTMGIRFSDFFIGSFIGLLPGTLSTVVLGDRLLVALTHASWTNLLLVVGAGAVVALTFALLRCCLKSND